MVRGAGSTAIRQATRKLRGSKATEPGTATGEQAALKPMTPNGYLRAEGGKFCTYLINEGIVPAAQRSRFQTCYAAWHLKHQIDANLAGWNQTSGVEAGQVQAE